MKKFTGLVIILAALILGGYYGMGVLTEKTIRKNIATIDQTNGLFAEIKQYKRGMFHSEAQIKWRLHVPERVVTNADGQSQTLPAQDYTMEMPITIHHGPVIFSDKRLHFGLGYADTVFPFPQQYAEQFDATFTKKSTKPRLDLSIFVNYFNQSTVDFNVPQFNLIAKQGNGHIEWKGMNATTTMASEMKKIDGTVVVDGLQITKDDAKIIMGKVAGDYDLHETSSGLYLGDANFKLPSFNVLIKDQKMFEIADLVIRSDSDIEEHLFNTNFNVSLKSLLANGNSYGPGKLDVALRNLDADILAKINQQAADMQNGTDAQRQQAMIAMLPELPKLFAKGAEFEISKLSLKIPQGQIDGNLSLSLPKGDSANPFALIQKISGSAKLRVPAAAVKQIMQQSLMQQMTKEPALQQALAQELQPKQSGTPETTESTQSPEQLAAMQADKQLAVLQQSGLIILEGTDYLIDVTLEQGKFVVNGKPFDSSMIKF